MTKYIIKNCPCYMKQPEADCWADQLSWCENCTDCVLKQIVDKLREADNSCDRINCTECSGFYMCHSKLANDILKLLDIHEVE